MPISTALEPQAKVSWQAIGFLLTSTLCFGLNPAAPAATLTNGALTIDIREDNGAIARVSFGNSDFFNPGMPISDYGFQNGTDTSTFWLNSTTGWTQQPVTVSNRPKSVIVTGTYRGGNANVDFTRTYSLISGLNVLRVETKFVNRGDDVALRYFDTFDPDQGVDRGNGFETYNDTYNLSTDAGVARVARATELGGLTVAIGSISPEAIIGQTTGIAIGNGASLNNFFGAPLDGNGIFADFGSHVGAFKMLLKAGELKSVTYDQAYGQSPEEANRTFIAANRKQAVPVPEPMSIASLAIIGAGGIARTLKRKSRA
ncbi:hypothetical protein [Oscillatoria sp. FACHB-1406]|uniref:hypothetical protein n=1 Tax=Oscillatoria sp. FACHB-1406 TaxID=2692846 RepID=UPI001689987F|nr:hypothetical protein [Oscillatoria sp. FACHB-1406]MBD2577575.1 hypothetical protein [Oscillatoria sp. FACHB-1406]